MPDIEDNIIYIERYILIRDLKKIDEGIAAIKTLESRGKRVPFKIKKELQKVKKILRNR